MKKILIITFLTMLTTLSVLAYNFNKEIPVKGKTLTTPQKQADMLFSIYAYGLRIAAPDCQDFEITDTNISKEKENGKWEEIWTLKACSRTAQIPIKFVSTHDNIIFSIDAMNVKVNK